MASQQPVNPEQATRVSNARARLLLDDRTCFFGAIALRLIVEENPTRKTMSTDGTRLLYNPAWTATQSDAVLMTVIAHEAMHCALLHPFRKGNRDHQEWNEATDYAINGELAKAGLELWQGAYLDPQYNGLPAETVYAKRHAEKPAPQQPPAPQPQPDPQGDQQAPGQGTPDPNAPPQQGASGPADDAQPGEVLDAPAPDPNAQDSGDGQGTGSQDVPPMTETDWKIATEQARLVAAKAGKMDGGLSETLRNTHQSREDWVAITREFVEQLAPSDYSWVNPDRNHIGSGLYLPGICKESIGRLDWVTDTSGSIDSATLNAAWGEFVALVRDVRPEAVRYINCDTRAHLIGEYTADDIPDTPPAHLGRGGTFFQPAFDLIAQQEEPPAAVLYFTDLECGDKPAAPEYPVLWITGIRVTQEPPPFGQVVRIDVNL